ncbi:kinase-like domain, beta-lactamase/transpeptidase-like protein [Tanacetum coccineum]|uniref:Kinase-like domain, beta-lactamase/transpeptidase-like protein n=1 Tax=Tanacetum coccineum TaxID=301880 RepID=A0ABQ5EHB6_9ASTR
MEISRGCNGSLATVIPKVVDPIGLGDFRHVSLIGCYYKIIAKMLVKRIKRVVENVIGEVQNAFIKGRYIIDGVLIANWTMEYLKKKKENGLIFKVDFKKAYDNINWGFLLDIMRRMRKRISDKRTKNQAKTDKAEHGMEEREKTVKIEVKDQKAKVN